MAIHWKILAVLTALVAAAGSSAWAAAPAGELVNMVVCKSPGKVAAGTGVGKAVRMLRMYTQDGDTGCVATYSKTNVERTVGTSRAPGQCQSILEGIRKNLEASHWACKSAASPKVLKSTQAAELDKSLRDSEAESALEKELN